MAFVFSWYKDRANKSNSPALIKLGKWQRIIATSIIVIMRTCGIAVAAIAISTESSGNFWRVFSFIYIILLVGLTTLRETPTLLEFLCLQNCDVDSAQYHEALTRPSIMHDAFRMIDGVWR